MILRAWDMGLLHRWLHTRPQSAGADFARYIVQYSASRRTDMTFVALDTTGLTSRHALLPTYKANRHMSEEEFQNHRAQHSVCLEALHASRVHIRCADGWEADDVLATVSAKAIQAGHSVHVHSHDKGLIQLMPLGSRLYAVGKEITLAYVAERFGVVPSHFVDYLAIAGDASDGIPGAKGIGKVGATEIITRYGDLDSALVQAASTATTPLLAKLLASRDDVLLARDIISLNCNVTLCKGLPHSPSAQEHSHGPDPDHDATPSA